MTIEQKNTQAMPALLCSAGGVDAQETKSLCCEAAGIIDPVCATAEALIPHEKLREAASVDAPLIAQERPPAQPVMGCKPLSQLDERAEYEKEFPVPEGLQYCANRDTYIRAAGSSPTDKFAREHYAYRAGFAAWMRRAWKDDLATERDDGFTCWGTKTQPSAAPLTAQTTHQFIANQAAAGEPEVLGYRAVRTKPLGNARLDRPLLTQVREGWDPAYSVTPLVDQAHVTLLKDEVETLRAALRTEVEAGDTWKREAQDLREERNILAARVDNLDRNSHGIHALGTIEKLRAELDPLKAAQGEPVADALRKDAERYQWLRERDLETIRCGGVFAGQTPNNIVLNGEDLDAAIDAAMSRQVTL
ncbi:hypothetical protein [Pseudomonas chlororaphis]|uniref:hypothetical protein n=1 Tax=Pseudomonas chlororaphis TaxID=587753 RepID=UPI000F6E8C6B|nr:hypothetical protein [Pseudomonas chlororaphis]AZC81153.1 C-5 cytosine-specific DNA methylase [Pseudomonas chlororaphis subsp. piscium]